MKKINEGPVNAGLPAMEQFEQHLNKIVAPILREDDDYKSLDLDDVGKDLDTDDEKKLNKGFIGDDMYNQLGKILDNSEVNTVTTDDGDTFKVTGDQARILRMLASSENLKPQPKLKFIKDIQTTAGLTDFLDIKDYHEIPQLFVKRYLG